MSAYFFVVGSVLVAGLLVGVVLRRAPWTLLLPLLPIAIEDRLRVGGGNSLHDGTGDRTWAPNTAADIAPSYRNGIGDTTLDLSAVPALTAATRSSVRLGVGDLRVRVPSNLAVRMVATVRFGEIDVAGSALDSGTHVDDTVLSPAARDTTAPVLTLDVGVTVGTVQVTYV